MNRRPNNIGLVLHQGRKKPREKHELPPLLWFLGEALGKWIGWRKLQKRKK